MIKYYKLKEDSERELYFKIFDNIDDTKYNICICKQSNWRNDKYFYTIELSNDNFNRNFVENILIKYIEIDKKEFNNILITIKNKAKL